MSCSLASIRRTASPIMGWSSIKRTVIWCWVRPVSTRFPFFGVKVAIRWFLRD